MFVPKLGEVDLVYTWVDGDNPEYQKECLIYSSDPLDLNPERFRDNVAILKYSLRSVEKHLGWVRNIYIVTKRPQYPEWLNTRHPRIKIVHHDEFFERPERHLPTFSSNAIELQLHRISGLSDYFVYMCDDFLLGRDVLPTDLITTNGEILLLPKWRGYGHVPHMIRKSQISEMIEEQRGYFEDVMAHRFRHTNLFPLDIVYPEYLMRNNLHKTYSHFFARRHLIDLQVGCWSVLKTRLGFYLARQLKPKFISVSDDMGSQPDRKYVQLLSQFLQKMFPDKSGYEF